MTASDLTEWIALFMMELTPDGQGGYRELPPADIAYDRPANVRQMSGNEVQASDQTASRIRYEISIRYEPGVSTYHRVLWRDQYLDITGIDNVLQAGAWLRLQCERKEAGRQ